MKALYLADTPTTATTSTSCWLFSNEFILLGALRGLRADDGSLVQLETEESLFLTLPKQRVSFTSNRERVTRLEKLQPKHNYTLVLVRRVYLCVSVCMLCFLKLYVYKSPLVTGGGSGDSCGKLESKRGESSRW